MDVFIVPDEIVIILNMAAMEAAKVKFHKLSYASPGMKFEVTIDSSFNGPKWSVIAVEAFTESRAKPDGE
jgi:hypothetical protein